jgi:hypothetical protein
MATRFLFDPPRRPKPKVGPNLKSMLVRCPSTSKLTDTGRTIEEKRWATAKLKTQKLTCAHCGSVYTWTKNDVILGRPDINKLVIFREFSRRDFPHSDGPH